MVPHSLVGAALTGALRDQFVSYRDATWTLMFFSTSFSIWISLVTKKKHICLYFISVFPWQHSNGERRAIQILLKEELHHEKQAEWDEGRKNGRTSWNEDMERRTDSERERVKDSEWHKDKQIERQARHKFTCHIVIQDIVAMTTF